MVEFRIIPNIFEQAGRKSYQFDHKPKAKLLHYLKKIELPFMPAVFVDGRKVNINYVPSDGDNLRLIKPLKADIIIILYWVIKIAYYAWTAYSIYKALTTKPKKQNFGTSGSGLDDGSPSNGWDGVNTTQSVGIPILVQYGERTNGGNVLNKFIRHDGEDQYFYVLYSLGHGEVEEIKDLKLNDQPIENFDNVTIWKRYGTADQETIPGFSQEHNHTDVAVELKYNDPYIHTTERDDVEGFSLRFKFPQGMYEQGDTGIIYPWAITYKVEYRELGETVWRTAATNTVSRKAKNPFYSSYTKEGLAPARYEIRITKTSEDDTDNFYKTGSLQMLSVDEFVNADHVYPGIALVGLKIKANTQIQGTNPSFSCVVKGKKVRAPKITETFDTDNSMPQVSLEDVYYDVSAKIYRSLADNRELFWDGITYDLQYTFNPIWCVYDLILNKAYGLGAVIEENNIDDGFVLSEAQYADTKVSNGKGGFEQRHRLDIIIDTQTKATDVLQQITASFNAFNFFSEGCVKIKIDKPDVPRRFFGMGNVVKDSFSMSWKSKNERYNLINVDYINSDKEYRRDYFVLRDTEINANTTINDKTFRLFCCRNSYAMRLAQYALKNSKYNDQMVNFKVLPEACGIEAGDAFYFAHDVPAYGHSGRIKSVLSQNSVLIDKTIELETGKQYKLLLQMSANDTQEEYSIVNATGSYDEIIIDGDLPGQLAQYDNYWIGDYVVGPRKYRCIDMKIGDKDIVEISGVELNDAVFTDDEFVLPESDYSMLADEVSPVVGLTITEELIKLKDGTIENTLQVWFQKPETVNYFKKYDYSKIYLSSDNGESWDYRGNTYGENFIIQGGIVDLSTYIVKVVSVSSKGEEAKFEQAPSLEIVTQGKTKPPANVENFDVSQHGNNLKFSWSPVPDADLSRYVIKKGSDWRIGEIIAEKVDATEFIYPVGQIGEVSYMVKAIDTSSNESEEPAIDKINIIKPPDMNFVQEIDLFACNLKYKLANLDLAMVNYHDSSYDRLALALNTQNTWEEVEDLGLSWGQLTDTLIQNHEDSGSYEMIEAIDLGVAFDFTLVTDIDYRCADGGSVEMYIAVRDTVEQTWSDFEPVQPDATYHGRYLKFKIVISTTNNNHNVYLYDALIFINAPMVKKDWGMDLAVPIDGTTVSFLETFAVRPRVKPQIMNGVIAYPVINIEIDQFTVRCYGFDGNPVANAEIDWEAVGY